MCEWKQIKLRDVGTIVTGNTPPTAERDFYGNEYVFIKPTDITEGVRYVESTEEKFSKRGYDKYQKGLLPINTPCIVTIGSLGKKLCLTKEPSFTNQAINAIIMDNGNDGKFVYYMMKIMLPMVKHLSSGTASGRENVSKSSFGNIKISVPSLQTQQKIVDILSVYDDLIDNNNRRIDLLEHAAQQIYKEWFVRFRFPSYETTHFIKGIPDGWEVKSITQIADITDGTHDTPKPVDTGYYLVTGKNIIKDTIDFSSAYYISEKDHIAISKRSGLERGNILFSNIGTIGSTCIIGENTDFSVKNVIIIKPFSDAGTCFLYCFLKNITTQEVFKQQAGGSSQQFIALGFMRKYKVLIPDSRVLENFLLHVKPILNEKSVLHSKNLNLIKQRDQLLSRLMSGKLEI